MLRQLATIGALAALMGCGQEPYADSEPNAENRSGTPELRAELFDTLVQRIERREAWSPAKNEALGFDPMEAVRAEKDAFVAADTEEALFYALTRVSAARRDRHLEVGLVPDGLRLPNRSGVPMIGADEVQPTVAPVKIFPDFGVGSDQYFIGDIAAGVDGLPGVGDIVVELNGMPVGEWAADATRYMRHSTTAGLRWKLAEAMTESTALFPPHLRSEALSVVVVDSLGERHSFDLPYGSVGEYTWSGVSEPSYPGFEVTHQTPTYDLLVSRAREVAVLVWTGFRETMVADVDALIEVAQARELLDYTLVVDVTRSRGGSRGAYAVQRIQAKPFKTTFGNLRLSDVVEPFVVERREAFGDRRFTDSGVPETIDDGTWLMEWLEEDVMPALARGDEYTNNVPFKSAHAPKDSDGVLEPAPVHFRGPFVVISGPDGGSHLDQFVHQVVDNELGPVVGMPPGGYSNTWEWEETLTFSNGQPVAHFMYNIGHTITPNGAIAEGNPATIDHFIPLTRDNVSEYYSILLEAALEQVEAGR